MNYYKIFIENYSKLNIYFLNSQFYSKKTLLNKKVKFSEFNLEKDINKEEKFFLDKYFIFLDIENYINYKGMYESIINKYFDFIITQKIDRYHPFNHYYDKGIIFDVSKTQKEKDLFLIKLVDARIIRRRKVFFRYCVSDLFFEKYYSIKYKNNLWYILKKSFMSLSEDYILKNAKILPMDFILKNRKFTTNFLEQLLDIILEKRNINYWIELLLIKQKLTKKMIEKILENIDNVDLIREVNNYYAIVQPTRRKK